jgi:membrane protease YdiL (CAAX protease family)
LFHIGVLAMGMRILMPPAPQPAGKQAEKPAAAAERNEHDAVRVWREDPRVATKLVIVFTAAIVAPLVEEFLFRLLLQGWLEAIERRLRRRLPGLRRTLSGLFPIVTVAALFAAMHFRSGPSDHDAPVLIRVLIGNALASVVTVVMGVAWLWVRAGATLADLGIEPRRLGGDVALGLAAFVAIGPLVLLLKILLILRFSPGIADPISLFFFALALGTLYYRTHRIVPAITLHMALNSVGVLLLLLGA